MAGEIENEQAVDQALRMGLRVHHHQYHHHQNDEQSSQKSVAALASSFPIPLPGRNRAYINGNYNNYYARHRTILPLNINKLTSPYSRQA